MASRCSTAVCRATGGGDAGDSVFYGGFGENLGWGDIAAQKIHNELAGAMACMRFAGIRGGNAGKSHRRNAEKFADESHSVGGELAAAGARSRTGGFFESLEPRVGHVAVRMAADGFVNVLDRDGVAFKFAGSDRTAVENQAWNIQTRQRHDAGGNGFVAANENDQGVKNVAAGDKLDGVGDHFAADQRSAHALRAHGDAVGNGNGVELERSAAGGANAVLNVHGQFAKVKVARADFDPGIRNADEGLGEIVITKPASAEHGACTGTMGTVDQRAAARLQRRYSHSGVLLRGLCNAFAYDYEPKKLKAIILVLDDGPETLR